MHHSKLFGLCMAGLLSAMHIAADAQQAFPERAIRIIVPQAAGSGTDLQARTLAQRLGAVLNQPVVVENRAGANGILGMEVAVRAKPDGYTLVYTTASVMTMNPFIFKKLPYDSFKDFVPLAQLGSNTMALVANPSLPVKSVPDLLAYAKARPNELSYGSFGTGNGTHLLGELMASATGINLRHIPYKGQTPAMADLIGGQVPLVFTTMMGASEHIKAGRVKLLATFGETRDPSFPDTPTLKELGYPDVTMVGWAGLYAPAGTPTPIVKLLQSRLKQILEADDFKEAFAKQGTAVFTRPPDEFTAYMRSEAKKWQAVIGIAGLAGTE
jgi:tripartite-type tricarboxylate transporter receptor subunit TctC